MSTLQDTPTRVSAPPTRPPVLPRPSALDRLAMRLGLRLLLWGRHRAHRRVDADAHQRGLHARQARDSYDRLLAQAGAVPPIR